MTKCQDWRGESISKCFDPARNLWWFYFEF